MSTPLDPTLPELLREAQRAAMGVLHTSLPGVVQSYDQATQTAVVRIAVKGRRRNFDEGTWETYTRKPLARVPVLWPGGGGAGLTLPLAAGDPVLVIFAERDVSQWLSTGTVPSDPVDPRMHDLSDAFAIPQVRTYDDPLDPTKYAAGAAVMYGSDIRLGGSSASDFVALSSRVLTELQKLTTWMSSMKLAFDAHTHISAAPASPTGIPTVSVPPISAPAAPTAASPAATTTKAL